MSNLIAYAAQSDQAAIVAHGLALLFVDGHVENAACTLA